MSYPPVTCDKCHSVTICNDPGLPCPRCQDRKEEDLDMKNPVDRFLLNYIKGQSFLIPKIPNLASEFQCANCLMWKPKEKKNGKCSNCERDTCCEFKGECGNCKAEKIGGNINGRTKGEKKEDN